MMRIKVRVNHWLPKLLNAGATTIYPWILIADGTFADEMLQHEFVHVRQVRRMGWLGFYLSYLWEYLKLRFKGLAHKAAYYKIPYEEEAYALAATTPLTAAEQQEVYG